MNADVTSPSRLGHIWQQSNMFLSTSATIRVVAGFVHEIVHVEDIASSATQSRSRVLGQSHALCRQILK